MVNHNGNCAGTVRELYGNCTGTVNYRSLREARTYSSKEYPVNTRVRMLLSQSSSNLISRWNFCPPDVFGQLQAARGVESPHRGFWFYGAALLLKSVGHANEAVRFMNQSFGFNNLGGGGCPILLGLEPFSFRCVKTFLRDQTCTYYPGINTLRQRDT